MKCKESFLKKNHLNFVRIFTRLSKWPVDYFVFNPSQCPLFAQDGFIAAGKADTRFARSLSSLPKVSLDTAPLLFWLNTDQQSSTSACTDLLQNWLPPRWPSGKASASRAEDPGFQSRLRRDFFRVESYQWLTNWHSSGYPARRLAL